MQRTYPYVFWRILHAKDSVGLCANFNFWDLLVVELIRDSVNAARLGMGCLLPMCEISHLGCRCFLFRKV